MLVLPRALEDEKGSWRYDWYGKPFQQKSVGVGKLAPPLPRERAWILEEKKYCPASVFQLLGFLKGG